MRVRSSWARKPHLMRPCRCTCQYPSSCTVVVSPLRSVLIASFRSSFVWRRHASQISLACIANTLIWGRGARSGSERSRESVIGHVVPTAGHIRISVVDCRPPWWSIRCVSAAARLAVESGTPRWRLLSATTNKQLSYRSVSRMRQLYWFSPNICPNRT